MEDFVSYSYSPNDNSGITVGFGVDLLGVKTVEDLVAHGIPKETAEKWESLGILGKTTKQLLSEGLIQKESKGSGIKIKQEDGSFSRLKIDSGEDTKRAMAAKVFEKVDSEIGDKYIGKVPDVVYDTMTTMHHFNGGTGTKGDINDPNPFKRKSAAVNNFFETIDQNLENNSSPAEIIDTTVKTLASDSLALKSAGSPLNSNTLKRELDYIRKNYSSPASGTLLDFEKVEAPEEFQTKQPTDIYSQGNVNVSVEDEVQKVLNTMNNEEPSDENYREGMGQYIKIRADIIKNGTDSRYWSERNNMFTEGEAANLQERGLQNQRRRGEFEAKTHMDWLSYQQHNKSYNELTPQERKDLKGDPYEPVPEWIQKQRNPTGITKVLRDIYKTVNPNAGKVWNQTYDENGKKVYVQKPPIGSIAHRSMEWKRPGYEGYDKQINVSHLKTMDDVVEKEIEPWVSKVEGRDVDIPEPLPTNIEKTTPITLEQKTVDEVKPTDTEEPEIIKQELTLPTDDDDKGKKGEKRKEWWKKNKEGIGQGLGIAAGAALGLLAGGMGMKHMNKALEDIPVEEMPKLDSAWNAHMTKMREMAQSGLTSEEKASANADLSKAYNLGVRNVMRAAGGSRGAFLANAGVLNANRVEGLLKLSAADAAMQRENMKNYGKALQYQNTYKQKSGQIDNKMAYDEAARKSNLHGQIGNALIETALENVSYAVKSVTQQPLMDAYAKLFEQKGFGSDIDSEVNQANRTKIT